MAETLDHSMSLTPPSKMSVQERVGGVLVAAGLVALFVNLLNNDQMWKPLKLIMALVPLAISGVLATRNFKRHKGIISVMTAAGIGGLVLIPMNFHSPNWLMFILVFVVPAVGALLYFAGAFGMGPAGIKNNGLFHSSATKQNGMIAWILTIVFTGFYILLYWFPENLYGFVAATDPLVYLVSGKHAVAEGKILSPWMSYTIMYTFLVLVMGFRFIMKYRHNRYQIIRTLSVSFFQLILAFLLPAFLAKMSQSNDAYFEHYFSYFWPLGYSNLWPDFLSKWDGESFSKFAIVWSIVLSFVAVPILTYYFGKRWYCSWVCGCGGLAETAGDNFRHLSDKSLKAWQIERVVIYGVLSLITIITAMVLINWKFPFMSQELSQGLTKGYGFLIGSIFAGVVGTGFYPILGNRVWCRFGCPQAAILGILQKYLSRFRITTNGAQCISCGNCSTHCEMGIDVKWYAQRGQNIVRASCVGCGVCSAVCPRGVLKLENGPQKGRMNEGGPISISGKQINVSE